MMKLQERQPYPDMIEGSGVTDIEYWTDDQGNQKILLIAEQSEVYYIRQDENGNILETEMLYPEHKN